MEMVMSISEDDVRQLAARREDQSLEFKERFYGPDDNAEMAKDIMAMANNLNADDVGHILFGVAENPEDHTGVIKGLEIPNWVTDSNLQQKVRSRLNKTPSFSWSNLLVDGFMIGVIEIHAGGRPFFPLKDEKALRRHIALRRIGSSTDIASPEDIIGWFRADELRRGRDLEIERMEQEVAVIPRVEDRMRSRNDRTVTQTVAVANDGHAMFSVASVSVAWEMRVPEWLMQEQDNLLHSGVEKPGPLVVEVPCPTGTIKSGEVRDIKFSTPLELLHDHFGRYWGSITRQVSTGAVMLPDVLHGTVSVKCQSLDRRRAAVESVGISW
jgi:hypothetical protein